MDRATGLQNNLNRWYNPKTGRWLSEDPIGFAAGDANLYRYVGNSPTMEKDPTGLAGGIGPVQAVKGIFGHFQDRLFGGGAGVSLPEAAVGIYDDVFEIPKDIHEKSKECRQNAMDRGGVDDWIIGVGIGSAGELFSQWSWIQCLRVPGPVKEVVKP